jgi:hypothetical protein
MTTAEATQAKRWLQIAVYQLLKDFEESTGLVVSSVDLKSTYGVAMKPQIANVTIKAELP